MKRGIPMELRPTQRFPEFIGQKLHDVRLGEVTEESTARNGSRLPPASVMGVRKEDGIVQMEGRLVAADISRYKLVGSNWFAYNPMRLNIGSIARWQGDSVVLVSPDYVVFRCLEQSTPAALHPEYLDHFRRSSQWDAFVNEAGDGGVRVRIYYRDISQLRLIVPDVVEQQKIADCLGNLDELIAAEGRKLEALRQHKQGLMQQLVPQPGETVPRLRFPEFHNAREWKTKNLEELILVQSGGTPPKDNSEYWNGSIPWVSAKDMKRLYLEDTEDHISIAAVDNGARLVPAGTLLMLTRGMTLHKNVPICVLRREMSFNQDVKALLPKAGVKGLFLVFALLANKQRLLNMVDIAGHGTGKLNTYELEAFELAFPQPAEQQRIATCLASLEDVLAAQAGKIDALKQQKQGLLQQLFPSLETE